MSIDPTFFDKLRTLPPDKQREVEDFVEFLHGKSIPEARKPKIKGLCADLGLKISDEEIAEARREMWGRFPRENPR
jgi:hypothetical protein